MKLIASILLLALTIINVRSQAGAAGPPGPPGPPGAPGLPAPCQDECVGKGCEPACMVGCCGYHGMYGKSGKWIREQILELAESEHPHETS